MHIKHYSEASKIMELFKFSIITISYNQAQFLEKTIISVLNQNYPNFEYIIVDPGSTDGSRDIILKYQTKLTKVIFEPDFGPANGLNKGFNFATGDIFGFINSDDFYLPNAFEKVNKYFNNHKNIDVVSGNALVIDQGGNFLRNAFSDKFSLFACAYGYSNLIQPSTFFRSKSFQKTNMFNTNNHTSWDGELFIDMKINGANFSRMNEFLSAFRIYESNITGSAKLDNEVQKYFEYRFVKIMKRKKRVFDKLISFFCHIYRTLFNIRDVFQRLIRGPIYGRFSQK